MEPFAELYAMWASCPECKGTGWLKEHSHQRMTRRPAIVIALKILCSLVGAILLPLGVSVVSDSPISTKPEMIVPAYVLFGCFGAFFGWHLSIVFFEPQAAARGALLFGLIGFALSFIVPMPRLICILTGTLVGAGYAGHGRRAFKQAFGDDD